MRNVAFSVVGCIVGILLGLLVYAFGVAVTDFQNEGLIWGIVAILIWLACTFSGRFPDNF